MDNPPEPYTPEGQSAWLASLTPDESLIVHTPAGYLMFFVVVALTKRALAMDDMKAGERLYFLEKLNGLTDQNFTPSMLATIEPMSDLEYEIFCEAKSLDGTDDKSAEASFQILTSPRVFGHLATLNPSFIAAMKQREQDLKVAEQAERVVLQSLH